MKLTITLLIVFFYNALFSQPTFLNQVSPETLDRQSYKLVARPNISNLTLPFEQIKILDKRFDTTKIGFELKPDFLRPKKRAFVKINLENSIALSIEKFYNDKYANTFSKNGIELLIVLKTLWISALPYSTLKGAKESEEKSNIDIHTKFEYYFKIDSNYVPIRRLDTIFKALQNDTTELPSGIEKNEMRYLTYCLKKMIEAPDYSYYISLLSKRTKKTLHEIESFNNQRFNLPILKDSIKKGIYLTFEEFKNNKPSIPNFTKKAIIDRFVFLDNEKPIRSFWGYYDGKELGYGTNGKYLMYRVCNTFEVFTFETVLKSVSVDLTKFIFPLPGVYPLPGPIKKGVWCPRQINMENGEVY